MNFNALTSLITAFFMAATPITSIRAADTLDLNLPNLGTVAGAELSPMDERALGEQLMSRVRADPTFMSDPEITEYLNRLGYQLVSHAQTHTYNFFFFAIRDASLNAFALPGGFIAVHTGTIIGAKNESELAGVIGHEIGHVSQRHIARMIEGQKSNLALTLGSILLAILAARAGGSSGGHAAAAIAMGTQAAMIQSQLNYSQDAEREADRVGLQTLSAAGFDPRGMENFFARLQANNRFYESAAPAYLSTHPLTVERLSDMENRTRQMRTHMHQDSLDFHLIQARATVLQATQYQGWLEASKQFRTTLQKAKGSEACVAAYGLSIALSMMNDPSGAYQAAQKSLACDRDNAFIEKNYLQTKFQVAKTVAERLNVVQQAKQSVERFPLSSVIAENYVDLLYATNQHKELIRFIRNNSAISPSAPDYHGLLARSYEALGQKSLQYMETGEMYRLLGASDAALYQFDLAQKANDGDFYTMSQIDANLRELREKVAREKKDRLR